MCNIVLYILTIYVAQIISFGFDNIYTHINWQTAVKINDYKTYRSSAILEYSVPQQALNSTWHFFASKSNDKCNDRSMALFLRQGSYPVINPLNETYPPNFSLQYVVIHSVEVFIGVDVVYTVFNPLPGSWFAVAYFSDFIDEKITQEGLSVDCNYFLGVYHTSEAFSYIRDIPVMMENQVIATASPEYYSFRISEYIWQYSVIVNCSSDSIGCRIRLSTRGQALPTWTNDNSHTQDCSLCNDSICQLTVQSPATHSLHYLLLESLALANISVSIFIQTYVCAPNSTNVPVDDVTSTSMPVKSVELDSNPALAVLNVLNQNWASSVPGSNSTSPSASLYNSSNLYDNHALMTKNSQPAPAPVSNVSAKQYVDSHLLTALSSTQMFNIQINSNGSTDVTMCFWIDQLGRYEVRTRTFAVEFMPHINIAPMLSSMYFVTTVHPLLLRFYVQPHADMGGTLTYSLKFYSSLLGSANRVVIESCIQYSSLPVHGVGVYCNTDNLLTVDSAGSTTAQISFPYPLPGYWYIATIAKCYHPDSSLLVECADDMIMVQAKVYIKSCVEESCNDNGYCYTISSGTNIYSTCDCTSGYRGYGCTDDSKALSEGEQLKRALFLTISNLFFIPSIILATYRCLFIEAFIYFYVMFFSTFYHACDMDSYRAYCIMPYDVLAVCDFFGSIMAVSVTLIAMARLPQYGRNLLHVLASAFLVMGVTWDRTSLWVFMVPTVSAFVIALSTWIFQCKSRHGCYPPLKRWVLYLIPGIIIASTGLILYAFFETLSNYWLIHSVWHMCMALCIVFILPPRKPHLTDIFMKGIRNCVCFKKRQSFDLEINFFNR